MFVHLVLIKLKPGVTRSDPRVKAWLPMFASLERKCSGIERFEHGWNTTDRPIAYDYGISIVFATRADLDAYGPHPAHQEIAHQSIAAATKSSNPGSSKVLAVITAPAAIMSTWLRLVRIPIVAMPADDAERTPERESSNARDAAAAAPTARNPSR